MCLNQYFLNFHIPVPLPKAPLWGGGGGVHPPPNFHDFGLYGENVHYKLNNYNIVF